MLTNRFRSRATVSPLNLSPDVSLMPNSPQDDYPPTTDRTTARIHPVDASTNNITTRNVSQYPLHNVTARHNESHIQVDKSMLKKKQNSEDETPQYEYKGPSNQFIHQMLVDLQRRSKSIVKEFCLVKKYNKLRTNIDNAFKNKFPTWLVEAKGPLAINTDSIILIIIMLSASLFYALKIESTEVFTDRKYGDIYETIHSKGALLTFVFTFYGLFFLSLSFRWVLACFLVQTTVLVLLDLADFNFLFPKENKTYNISIITCRTAIGFFGLFWTIVYPIYKVLRNYGGRLMAHFFIIMVCLGIALILIGTVALSLLSKDQTLKELCQNNASNFAVVAGIIVSLSWITIHFKYFWVPSHSLEVAFKQLAKRELKKLTQKTSYKPKLESHFAKADTRYKTASHGFWVNMQIKLEDNIYWISSLVIGGTYIAIELFLLERIVYALRSDQSHSFITAVFFFIGIPIFLLVGIPIGLSKGKLKNKTLILPLAIMVPMLGAVPLANRLGEWGDTAYIAWYLIAGPPAACFFWLAMAFLGLRRRRLFYGLTMVMCLFLFVPFALLGLRQCVLFSDSKKLFLNISISLFVLGGIAMMIFALLKVFSPLYFKIKKKIINSNINLLKRLAQKRISLIGADRRDSADSSSNKKGFEDDVDASLDHDLEQLKSIYPGINKDETRLDANHVSFRGNKSRNELTNKSRVEPKEPKESAKTPFQRASAKRMTMKETYQLQKKKQMFWANLIYLNLKRSGYWINAGSFIVSYTFVTYSLFNITDTASANERGTLIGVSALMPCIFIVNNILIRMKSTKFTQLERDELANRKESEAKLYEGELKSDQALLKRASVLEIIILVCGILLIPAMQIPLLFVFQTRQSQIINLVILIGSSMMSLFIIGLVEIKKRSGPFHKFFIPAFVGICWIFVVFPFIVLIPLLAIIFNQDQSKFESLVKGTLTGSAFLLMIGVTVLAIVVNVFFQKLEEEKLIKFIVRYLQKIFNQNAVKAGNDVVRRLVEQYRRTFAKSGAEQFKTELIQDKFPVVPLYPPQFVPKDNYGAKLVSYETYNRFLKAFANRNMPRPEKKKLNFLERLLKCCSEEEEDEDLNFDLNLDENANEGFRVDDYLPEDFENQTYKWDIGNPISPQIEVEITLHDPKEEEPSALVVDLKAQDHMTPFLEGINLKAISKEEARNINRGNEGMKIQKNNNELETWYQHLYDFLSGKIKDSSKSNGLIYRNFEQFLRIVDIKIDAEQKGLIFAQCARIKTENDNCLSYMGFIQSLVQVASLSFPNRQGNKLLKTLTKTIFPPMMRIPEFGRNYSLNLGSSSKITSPYVPELGLFENANRPLLPLSSDLKIDSITMRDIHSKDSTRTMIPQQGDKSPNNAASSEFGGSGTEDNSNYLQDVPPGGLFKPRQIQRNIMRASSISSTVSRPSAMQNIEDEIFLGPDSGGKLIASLNERSPGGQLRRQQSELRPSKFGVVAGIGQVYTGKKPKKKNAVKGVCRRMILALAACMHFFGRWIDYFIEKGVVFLTYISSLVYNSTKGIGKALGFSLEEEHRDADEEEADVKRVKDAPEWSVLVNKVTLEIGKAEELYFWKYHTKGLVLMFNFANVLAFIAKFRDFYSYAVIAFSEEIPWFSTNKFSSVLKYFSWDVSYFDSFYMLFWTSIALVGITIVLAVPAIYYLRQGRLGENKHGNKAQFPDSQFFLTVILATLAGSLFCQIMNSLLEVYVCNFSKYPWTLRSDSTVLCLSDHHLKLMGIATLAILLYYPISTFMYPNFQFQDKGLDLKYDPSFLVLNIQAKLLITGFLSFFKPESEDDISGVIVRQVGVAVILFLLALITIFLRPCLIKRVNVWDVAFYLLASWANLTGVVVLVTKKSLIGFLLLFAGVITVTGLTAFILKKYFKKKRKRAITKKRAKIVPIKTKANAVAPVEQEDYVRYDSAKRQAEIPANDVTLEAGTPRLKKLDNPLGKNLMF